MLRRISFPFLVTRIREATLFLVLVTIDIGYLFLADLDDKSVAAEFRFAHALIFDVDYFKKFFELPSSEIFMGFFPPSHSHNHRDLVAAFQEFFRLPGSYLEVVPGGPHTDLYLLPILAFLLSPLFLQFLLFLISEFVKTDDFGNGGFSGRGDFDQVETPFFSKSKGLFLGHDTEVLAFVVYYPEFGRGYLVVGSQVMNRDKIADSYW